MNSITFFSITFLPNVKLTIFDFVNLKNIELINKLKKKMYQRIILLTDCKHCELTQTY